jgi:hypothetical protein
MSLDLWARTQDRVGAKVAEAGTLATSGRPLTVGWLEQAAAWIGEITPTWEQLTGAVPLERTYLRLAASPHMEAWLICWPTDGRLQLHDHGGASGAFHVIAGKLDERSVVGGVWRDRRVPPGEVVSFDGAYIHDLRNTRSQPATSVHIYGPATSPMSFYRVVGGTVHPVAADCARALREQEAEAEGRAGETRVVAQRSGRRPVLVAAAQSRVRSAASVGPAGSAGRVGSVGPAAELSASSRS